MSICGCFVSEYGASNDQVIVLAEVDKSASVVINDTIALFPITRSFSSLFVPTFALRSPYSSSTLWTVVSSTVF